MADSAAGRKMLDRCAVQKLTGRHSTEEAYKKITLRNTTPYNYCDLVYCTPHCICAINNICSRCLNLHLDNLLLAAVRDVLQIGSDIPPSLLPDRGIPWILVAKAMKNMRQPLDYLRRWPRTKRRAVLADANAIRDLQGNILLNSKSAYCKLKEWKGSRSHNSSSSRRDARGHVTTSSRKRNTSDCDSESDSDMSLMIVPAKQSRKVVARPGKILAPKNFKGMTTVCRDNTLIWLKVIEDVFFLDDPDSCRVIPWADVDRKLLLNPSYSSGRWRCLSKNLPSTLTFRQKIAELQKIVEHCVVVDEKRPSETLYENNIDENSNFECLRKLKNGRGRRKKKCEMIVEEEEKINKKELAIKKIFSFKEFHFNSGKKQKMIEKVFRDWNYAEKIMYSEIVFNDNKKQSAIDKVSGQQSFTWQNKSRKKLAIEKVLNDWNYSDKILYKTKKPKEKKIKEKKIKEKKIKEKKIKEKKIRHKKIKEKKVRIKIVKERKLKEKKTPKVRLIKDTNRERDERLQRKRNRIESGMSGRPRVRDVRGMKRSSSNPRKRYSKKVIADEDDVSIDFGDSDSGCDRDSDSDYNNNDKDYEMNIDYHNQYDNENSDDSDSGSDTDNQLGIGSRIRMSAMKQPRVSASYQSFASRQRNDREEEESQSGSGSETDPFKSDSDSDKAKLSRQRSAMKQPRVSASYQSFASRQRNDREEEESQSGSESGESESDMEIDVSYQDQQEVDQDEEDDDNDEEEEVGEELKDELDVVADVMEEEEEEEEEEEAEEGSYVGEIGYTMHNNLDSTDINDIDQEWMYEEEEVDFWDTEEVIVTGVELVGNINEKLDLKDEKLNLKDEKLNLKDKELDLKDKELDLKDEELDLKDEEFNRKDEVLDLKDEELNLKDEELILKDEELILKDEERRNIIEEEEEDMDHCREFRTESLSPRLYTQDDENCVKEESEINEGDRDTLRETGLSNFELQEKRKRKQERSDRRERKKIRAEIRANLSGSKKMTDYDLLNVSDDSKGRNVCFIEVDKASEEKMTNCSLGYANSELIEKLKRKQERSDARERKKIRADLRLSRARK